MEVEGVGVEGGWGDGEAEGKRSGGRRDTRWEVGVKGGGSWRGGGCAVVIRSGGVEIHLEQGGGKEEIERDG